MAIILSNRLKAMQDAAANFGDSIQGIREAQRQAKRQAEADKMNKVRFDQEQELGGLQISAAKAKAGDEANQRLAMQEAQGFADDLTGFGTAVPESAIGIQDSSMFGGAPMASPRPMGDRSAENLKDRLTASMLNKMEQAKGGVSALTKDDIAAQRRAAQEKAAQGLQSFTLDTQKKQADIEKTKADTEGSLMDTRKTKQEIDKLEKQMNNAGGTAMAITKDNEGVWDKLFSGYRTDTKSTKDSLGQIRKLEALVNSKATGASDIATLYTFIRSFDSPNSAVREAEANMGQEAAGALNKLMNLRAKYEKGRILPDVVRQEMLEAVQTIKADHENLLNATDSRYGRLATSAGLDPSLILDNEFKSASRSPVGGGTESNNIKSFKSAREAMSSGLPPGTIVMINGVEAEI